jgi:c(7)-type cytochrome triheme protein
MGTFLRRITFWRVVAGLTLLAGLYATVVRFSGGLGAATNLSDNFPWGLWIGFDLLVGVGLAAGGFTIAATVHIFHLKRFEPIVRPSVLTAFLGYLLVIVALLFDIGRPYRIWHPVVMWNPRSAMFAIAWCEMLYAVVLALEISPAFLERFNLVRPLKAVRAIVVPLTIVAVLLSTVHQSFLGTLYVIVPDKLHGLWYSPLLPVFFFLTAIAAGLAMVILESFMSARAFKRNLETHLLEDLTPVIVVILAVYLVMKVQDMYGRSAFALLAAWGPEQFLFLVEMFFGTAAPLILLLVPSIRRERAGLFCSALLVVLGFVLNRLNVSITGMQRGLSASYFPSFMEVAVTAMLVVVGFVAFALAVRYLHVFPKAKDKPRPEVGPPRPASVAYTAHGTIVALGIVLLLGVLTVDFDNAKGPAASARANPTTTSKPKIELKLPGEKKLPVSSVSPGPVTFNHESHVDSDKPVCITCHAGQYSLLGGRASWWLPATGKNWHSAESCGACHTGKTAFNLKDKDNCENCHSGETAGDKKSD